MIAALFDTNVLYSALVRPRGSAEILLRLAAAGKFELWVSSCVLNELAEILHRPKARKELGRSYTKAQLLDALEALAGAFFNIGDAPPVEIVEGDARDDHLIGAAVYAQVDYLVSGDKKHILSLGDHRGIRALGVRIVSVSEFAGILATSL